MDTSPFKSDTEGAGQEPSSGKAPRSWVPRACDRCRKRKARCDQLVPCRNCAEAGATCTHDAPILKRGPRPKPRNRDVESRLRNLESLLASISAGSSSAALSLSRRELDQIRLAADITPRSDNSPLSETDGVPGQSTRKISITAVPAPVKSTSNPAMAGPGPSLPEGYSDLHPSSSQVHASSSSSSLQPVFVSGMDIPKASETFGPVLPPLVYDPFGVTSPSQAVQIIQPASYDAGLYDNGIKPASVSTKGHDLLYRDAEGQTKWLGPSSGLPLLERLKLSGTSWNTANDSTNTLAEEWISLSNAIGLDVDTTASLDQFAPFVDTINHGPTSPASTMDDLLWGRVTTLCPPDLIDGLVRAYFTISHLLWPILHAPTFMHSYVDADHRRNPSFIALVLSICSLSSRYTPDVRLLGPSATTPGSTVAQDLIALAKEVTASAASERSDLYIVQALFNLSVVQEGTARTNQLWSFLSQAVSIAMDMGLHRRKDDYGSFTAVDLEEQKRTLWALYCQTVAASCTYGRPSMLRLADIELDEPAAVDDVYISVDQGIGTQPLDRPSVMAGFVAGVRLHMILERVIRRVNRVIRDVDEASPSFLNLISPVAPRIYRIEDELELLGRVTDGLPGDWSFSPSTVSDPDSVRFFQKTRVFTLQQFIRLLSARHKFTEILGAADATTAPEEHTLLQQITQSALGIVGTYSIIDSKGRLDFFGAHAISQLTQAGAGLIGVILHLRSVTVPGSDQVLSLALQGMCASIMVLRQLGHRRPAGNRSAELLVEFSRVCRITIPGLPEDEPGRSGPSAVVDVPMLRAIPRRSETPATATGFRPDETLSQAQFDQWLGLALQGGSDVWMDAAPSF